MEKGHYRRNYTNHLNNCNNSVVMIGCSNCNVVNNRSVNEWEAELIRMFRTFPVRKQNEILSHFYEIEDSLKSGDAHGTKE